MVSQEPNQPESNQPESVVIDRPVGQLQFEQFEKRVDAQFRVIEWTIGVGFAATLALLIYIVSKL